MFLFGKKANFNKVSMKEAGQLLQADPSILLLDVRTPDEFRGGHIPGSVNLALDRISQIGQLAPEPNRRIFVYCHSGARSRTACTQLARAGYTDITDMGGIIAWPGETVR